MFLKNTPKFSAPLEPILTKMNGFDMFFYLFRAPQANISQFLCSETRFLKGFSCKNPQNFRLRRMFFNNPPLVRNPGTTRGGS